MSKKHRRPSPTSLSQLSDELVHERDSLIELSAGLQLCPENATKWMRFDRLREIVASITPNSPQYAISPGRLRHLLTSPPIASEQVVANEDPNEESFISSVTFHGGNFRLVAGGATEAHAGCQIALSAIQQLPEGCNDFKNGAQKDAFILLSLSEEMCRAADLENWSAAPLNVDEELFVPSDALLGALCDAANFSGDRLSKTLGALSHEVSAFVADGPLGLYDHETKSPTDDRSYLFPLLELSNGNIVIASPGNIAASITHRILLHATEYGCLDVFSELLQESVMRAASKFLSRLRWKAIARPSALSPSNRFREQYFRFDSDKIAHVVGIVDPLADYLPGEPFGSFDASAIQSELDARILEVNEAIRAMGTPTILHVIVSARLGRDFFIEITRDAISEKSAVLVASSDELDVLTRLESPEPLGLWRFAQAMARLHGNTRLQSFSQLDEYAVYRDHDSSFYLGDDGLPDALLVPPASAAAMRMQERERSNQHAIALHDDITVVEVSRWAADDGTPIYRPDDADLRTLHVVELDCPCWVIPSPSDPAEAEASEDLAEAVAFWIWKCRDLLQETLSEFALESKSLKVRTRFASQSVEQAGAQDIHPVSRWLVSEAQVDKHTVTLTVLDGAAIQMATPGNEAERAIAAALVCAINELKRVGNICDAEAIAASLESGPMKMMQVFGADDDLLLALGYTGAPRLVSPSDVDVVLTEVGQIAAMAAGHSAGDIEPERRIQVLNEIVAKLFESLSGKLLLLSPSGLLESLASEQESLIFMEARNTLLIPSYAACFGSESSALRRAISSSRELTTTAIANRFLIEFVTAVGPSGDQTLSCGLYDELIAIAQEIVQLGFLSDAIRHGLSTAELSILRSGRLGISREEPYYLAVGSFSRLASSRLLGDASKYFAGHWASRTGSAQSPDTMSLEEAFLAEFGVTASELAQISAELIELSRGNNRQISTWTSESLVAHLHETLTWSEEKLQAAMKLLSLGPLENYPPTANLADSYPWRFSRDRSSVRRPLLDRTSDDVLEIVWGPRAVYRAGRYLLDQILADRIGSKSKPMQQFIADARKVVAAAFQHEVADLFKSAENCDVLENVKKIGKLRLTRSKGEDIGDIDVFVIDHASKLLLAIEVKDFEFARTPVELKHELDKLFSGKKSASFHHRERLRFLETNREQIHQHYALAGTSEEWQIQGEIVASRDLLANHLMDQLNQAPQVKVSNFDGLVERAGQGRLIEREIRLSH